MLQLPHGATMITINICTSTGEVCGYHLCNPDDVEQMVLHLKWSYSLEIHRFGWFISVEGCKQ